MATQEKQERRVPIRQWLLTVGVALQVGAVTAFAHHSFSGAYDYAKALKLKGTIRNVEWINPHSMVHFIVKQPNGQTQEWTAEVGTPNALVRVGLTKTSFAAGTEIVVSGYRARDGSNKMNGQNITTPDGKPLFSQGDQ